MIQHDNNFVLSRRDRLEILYWEAFTPLVGAILFGYVLWSRYAPRMAAGNAVLVLICCVLFVLTLYFAARFFRGVRTAIEERWYSSRHRVTEDRIEKHYAAGLSEIGYWPELESVQGGATFTRRWPKYTVVDLPATELIFKDGQKVTLIPRGSTSMLEYYRPLVEMVANHTPIEVVGDRRYHIEFGAERG